MKRYALALALIALVVGCGEKGDTASTLGSLPSAGPSAASHPAGGATSGVGILCDRIDDDEALTPPGARELDMPEITSSSGERRCMVVFGVDASHEEVRQFYRSALADRGYEIADWTEGEGIVEGNLGRTFIRATKPGTSLNVTIDEFDREATRLSDYRIHGKMQFDEVGG